MDLKHIVIKLDKEDQGLILLNSLSALFDSFVNSMLYGKDTNSLVDVKSILNYKELRTKLGVQGMNNQSNGLIVKYSSGRRGSD